MQHRRLAHLYSTGDPLFVTFQLHDTLPPGRSFPKRIPSGKAFLQMDRLLDEASEGSMYLRMPNVANIVIAAIRKGTPNEYTRTPG